MSARISAAQAVCSAPANDAMFSAHWSALRSVLHVPHTIALSSVRFVCACGSGAAVRSVERASSVASRQPSVVDR